ncbi:MAG: hypothetical protein JRI23_01810 [Deltaproteobacteria bacterium]|jgi:hypothetical protein|nr:hypothetical protein [Deltaproteobacteria bacterium]MBW2530210.1 hypothetical protein [Deltaproteobacteria bacterium]
MQPYGGAGVPPGGAGGGWAGAQQAGPAPGYPQPAGPPLPPPPKKKSPLLWILLGCGGLAVLVGIVVVVLAAIGLFVAGAESSASPAPVGRSATPATPPSPAAPPNTKRFVNQRAGLKQDFVDNFVPFALDYPNDWRLAPDPGNNFVRLSLRLEKTEGDVTKFRDIEVFSAGYFNVPLTELRLENFMPQGSKKLDERPVTLGSYQGKELRFQLTTSDGDTLFARIIALPSSAAKDRGLLAFALASTKSPNVSGVDDVGKKGGLATILGSLKLGDDAAGASAAQGACSQAKDMAECLKCCVNGGYSNVAFNQKDGCSCAK